MIMTTTFSVEGSAIEEYLGIVTGEAVMGTNVFKDIGASFRDFFGGRSSGYEEELLQAKEIALKELGDRAKRLGANGIVGIDLDYQTVGESGSMLMVTASGTAVRLA